MIDILLVTSPQPLFLLPLFATSRVFDLVADIQRVKKSAAPQQVCSDGAVAEKTEATRPLSSGGIRKRGYNRMDAEDPNFLIPADRARGWYDNWKTFKKNQRNKKRGLKGSSLLPRKRRYMRAWIYPLNP